MADKRDIQLQIAVSTAGADSVQRLSDYILELAKDGGVSAEGLGKLGDELANIAAQTRAVSAINDTTAAIEKLTVAETEATAAAQKSKVTVAERAAALDAARQAEEKAKSAQIETARSANQAAAAIAELRLQYQGSARNTDEYRNKLRELQTAQLAARQAEDESKLAIREAAAARREASTELNKATAAQSETVAAANKAAAATREQVSELAKLGEKATKAGIDISNLDAANESLISSQKRLNAESRQAVAAVEAQTAAEKQLASIAAAVSAANERNVGLAKQAAQARVDAANRVIAAERQQQAEAERAALAAKLAAEAQANAAKAAEQAAKQAAAAMSDAFGKVGVRSVSAIKEELDQVRAALASVRSSGQLAGSGLAAATATATARVRELERELRAATGQMTLMDQASAGLGNLASGANALITKFGALGAAIGTAAIAIKPMVDAIVDLDRMRRALTTVTGSAVDAEAAIENLRSTAQRVGISAKENADAYVKFTSSLRLSGVSAAETSRIFEAVAGAASRMGLSSEKTSLVLDALSQMANKGVVSMEELRQQMGDSLPGALSLMAKGLGITEQQLVKMVESGQLLTRDAIGPLADALTQLGTKGGQDVDGLTQKWNRFKNVLYESMQTLGESGPIKAVGYVLEGLGKAVEYTAYRIVGLGEAFTVTGRTIGVAVADIVTQGAKFRGFSDDAKKAFQEIQDESDAKLKKLVDRMNGVAPAATSAANSLSGVGSAATAAGQQSQAAAGGVQANAAAHHAAAGAATQNAGAQTTAATATAASGLSASQASAAWVKLAVDYKLVNESTAAAVVVSEKLAKAKALEGQAIEAIAKLSGDEFSAIQAAAQAAELEAAAQADVAEKRNTQVAVLKAELAAREALAKVLGDPDGSRAKQIADIQQNIEKLNAEAEAATNAARATKLDADAKALATQTYGDNSRSLDGLKSAYEQAAKAAQMMTDAKAKGLVTAEEVNRANIVAAQAERLYRDAVNDTVSAYERKKAASDRALSIGNQSLLLDKERLRTEEQTAKSLGNTTGELQAQIAQKQIDLRVIQAKVAALRQEADALLVVAQAQIAALKTSDPLYAQKKAEIQARIDNAKLMKIEADTQAENAKQIAAEIELMQRRGTAATASSQQVVAGLNAEVGARERAIAAQEKENDLNERAIALENKRRNVDANGFSKDKAGNTINAAGSTRMSIMNELKGYGLADADAMRIAQEFADGNGNISYFNNAGQVKYGGNTLSEAVQKAAEQFLFNSKVSMPGATTPASTGTSGGTTRVEIVLNGATTSIGVNSAADASALTNLLQQLSTASQRSA